MTSGRTPSPAGDDERCGQEAVDEEDDEEGVLAEPVDVVEDEPESPDDPLDDPLVEALDAPEPAEPELDEPELLVALVALLEDRESVL
jgi:hypothetical protein